MASFVMKVLSLMEYKNDINESSMYLQFYFFKSFEESSLIITPGAKFNHLSNFVFFSFNVYNNSSTTKTQYVPTWLPKTLLEFLRIYIFGIYKIIISFDGRAGNLFSPYLVFWWATHCTCSECCIENSVWSLSYDTEYYNVIIDDAVCRILNCRWKLT